MLLDVAGLTVTARVGDADVPIVRDAGFTVAPGRILGIVGESGAGKSTIARVVAGLLPPGFRIASGSVTFEGEDLPAASAARRRELLGRRIAFIPQAPLSSLNPVVSVGRQFAEHLAHARVPRAERRGVAARALAEVRLDDSEALLARYPFQLSGGMCQRVLIAMAFATNPALIVADEPTTALDVTVQAQILELLGDLNRDLGTAIVMITHNMGVVAGLCSRVLVMYAGEIVEQGPVEQIFENPQHPYTWSLLRSIPRVDALRHERLRSIEGLAPDLLHPPAGCRFHPRCPFRIEKCFTDEPRLQEVAPDQLAACWVTMARARKEMGADDLIDIRPGAGSGVRKGELTD